MGADGHVTIYDLRKIKAELSDDEIEPLTCGTCYKQDLEGREYLTVYHGDNLDFNAGDYDERFGWCTAEQKKEAWYITKEEFQRRWNIVYKHRITSREVWT